MSIKNAVAVIAGATVTMDKSNIVQTAEEFRKWITADSDGNVQFVAGASEHVTVDGLSASVALDAKQARSILVRGANTLRLARKLPAINVPLFEADGKPVLNAGVPVMKTRDAFEVACERVQALVQAKGDGAFYKVNDLVKTLDLLDKNPALANVKSIFALNDARPYLEKVFSGKKVVKSDPVVKALIEQTPVNVMHPIVQRAKLRKPELFPAFVASEAKKKADAEAKAANGGKVVTPKPGDTFTLVQLVADIRHAALTRDHLVKTGQLQAVKAALAEVAEELKGLYALMTGMTK